MKRFSDFATGDTAITGDKIKVAGLNQNGLTMSNSEIKKYQLLGDPDT